MQAQDSNGMTTGQRTPPKARSVRPHRRTAREVMTVQRANNRQGARDRYWARARDPMGT